jgi:hypothetical protein
MWLLRACDIHGEKNDANNTLMNCILTFGNGLEFEESSF